MLWQIITPERQNSINTVISTWLYRKVRLVSPHYLQPRALLKFKCVWACYSSAHSWWIRFIICDWNISDIFDGQGAVQPSLCRIYSLNRHKHSRVGYVRKFQRRRLVWFGISFESKWIGMVCWGLCGFLLGLVLFIGLFVFTVEKMEDRGLWGRNME